MTASLRPCLPHARGGVSPTRHRRHDLSRSSPRPWGCFHAVKRWFESKRVFPTPVGVFPRSRTGKPMYGRLPHARGGVSSPWPPRRPCRPSSPRPWGCFSGKRLRWSPACVFPTPVGVFRINAASASLSEGLPHARGGVSTDLLWAGCALLSSPRPWGCFLTAQHVPALDEVFPTPVGVFPRWFRMPLQFGGLPHARGGVSRMRRLPREILESSPRPWGCFSAPVPPGRADGVFPTPVGVFPT